MEFAVTDVCILGVILAACTKDLKGEKLGGQAMKQILDARLHIVLAIGRARTSQGDGHNVSPRFDLSA